MQNLTTNLSFTKIIWKVAIDIEKVDLRPRLEAYTVFMLYCILKTKARHQRY